LIPSESGEKITLGVTILLAFFVNSLESSNYTPEAAAELPVIGVYYTFNIIMNALSLFGSVIILRLHFKKHSIVSVPKWIKTILLIADNNKKKNRIFSIIPKIKKSKKQQKCENMNYFYQNYTYKLYKLQKSNLKKKLEENMKLKRNEEILNEWKLVTKRLEYLFLFINVFTNTLTSIILFGKYFFYRLNYDNKCSCEYSFIR
jgi:hypothetical protein